MRRHAKASGNMWQLHKRVLSAICKSELRLPQHTHSTQWTSIHLNLRLLRHRLPPISQPPPALAHLAARPSDVELPPVSWELWMHLGLSESSWFKSRWSIIKHHEIQNIVFLQRMNLNHLYNTWIYWEYKPLQTVYSKHTKILKWRQVVFYGILIQVKIWISTEQSGLLMVQWTIIPLKATRSDLISVGLIVEAWRLSSGRLVRLWYFHMFQEARPSGKKVSSFS